MISYVVCLFRPDIARYMCLPGLLRQKHLYGAQLIFERDDTSLYAACERGRQRATFPTVVYLHDDVALLDFDASPRIIDLMNRAECGLMGVVGASKGGNSEVKLPWWDNGSLVGGWQGYRSDRRLYWNATQQGRTPCEPYTGQRPARWDGHDRKFHPLDGGWHNVDQLDGIILCDRTNLPWLKRDGWHGYDADRCNQAKAAGHTVAVGDLLVCHGSQAHDAAHNAAHKARMAEIREEVAA